MQLRDRLLEFLIKEITEQFVTNLQQLITLENQHKNFLKSMLIESQLWHLLQAYKRQELGLSLPLQFLLRLSQIQMGEQLRML